MPPGATNFKMLLEIAFNLLFIHTIIAQEVGERCTPSREIAEGRCVVITNCEPAVRAIRNRNHHGLQRCGFDGLLEIVCCPMPAENKFGSSTEPTRQTSAQPTMTRSQRKADQECQKIVSSSIPALDLHIIGGEMSSLGEFPHMVALGYERENGYAFDCGGSLLSKTFVLTAAHCVDTLDRIEPSIVRMGVVEIGGNRWAEESDARITEVLRHPNYLRKEKYHDLALLKLDRQASFSSNLNAACLYTNSQDPTATLTVTGWGTTSTTNDQRSNVLLKANVTLVSRETCGKSYSNWRKLPRGITDEQLCAGDPEGLRDTCQGDSGGPLQALTDNDGVYRIIGITSFGRGCGSPIPGVYTRVYHYLDWIESVVWPN